MAQKRIVIAATPREPISVDLIGTEYLVTPPKTTVAIALAERVQAAGQDIKVVREETDLWVNLAFGAKQGKKVIARLDDPEDDLDIPHIMDLMQKLAEAGTENPTT